MNRFALVAPLALLLAGAAPPDPPTPLLTMSPGVMPRGLPAMAERVALSPSGERVAFLTRRGDGFAIGVVTSAGVRLRAVSVPNALPLWVFFASEDEVVVGHRIVRPTETQVEGFGRGSDKAVADLDFVSLLGIETGSLTSLNQPERGARAKRSGGGRHVIDIERLGAADPQAGTLAAVAGDVAVTRVPGAPAQRTLLDHAHLSLADQLHVLDSEGTPTLRVWGSANVRLLCLNEGAREVARFGRAGEAHPYWPIGPGPRTDTVLVVRRNEGRYDELAVMACPEGRVEETILTADGDIQGVLRDHATGQVIGAWTGRDRPAFAYTDEALAKIMRRIANALPGEAVWPVSVSTDGPVLVFAEDSGRFLVFDREASALTPLLTAGDLGR